MKEINITPEILRLSIEQVYRFKDISELLPCVCLSWVGFSLKGRLPCELKNWWTMLSPWWMPDASRLCAR